MKYSKFTIKKNLFLLMFLVFLSTANAQTIRGFGSLSCSWLNDNFVSNVVRNSGAGLEFKINPLVKPEIGFSYSYPYIENRPGNYDFDSNTLERLSIHFYMLNFDLGSKIYFLYDGDDIEYSVCKWYITPKLNMSRIVANGNYMLIDYTTPENSILINGKSSGWRPSLGVTIGMEFPIGDSGSLAFAGNMNFLKVNLNKTLNNLPNNNIDYGKIGGGLEIRYYFGIRK